MFNRVRRGGGIAANAGGEKARANEGSDIRRKPEGTARDDGDCASLIWCWPCRESLVGGIKGEVGIGEGKGVKIGVEEVIGQSAVGIGSSWWHL